MTDTFATKEKKHAGFSRLAFWRKPAGARPPRIETVWVYTLALFFLLNVVSLALSFLLFVRIRADDIFHQPTPQAGAVETINRDELRATREFFSERDRRFEELQTNAPVTSDPAR